MKNVERELLKELVEELSAYNADDMLGGYLNDLCEGYNKRLAEVGLEVIEECHTRDED